MPFFILDYLRSELFITAELCTAAHAVNERRLTGLCLVCFVLIHKQGDALL